jgi:hypothetical protein
MFFEIVIMSLIAMLVGLAVTFFGFRLFVILLPIWAFFAGFLATAQAIQELFGGGFLATVSSWVFALVVGVMFAVAAYFFYYAAIAILAATVGYELGVGFMVGIGVSSGFLQFIVGVALAVLLIVAVIVLNLPKAFIIALTALGGAGMILAGIFLALGRIAVADLGSGIVGSYIRTSWFWVLVYLAIAAFGIVVQFMLPGGYAVTPYGQAQGSLQAPPSLYPESEPSQPLTTPPSEEGPGPQVPAT